MTKEEVVHANLKIIEQRLRNVFNCGYEYAKNEVKEEIERELRMETAAIKSMTDEEVRLVKEDAYRRGFNDGYDVGFDAGYCDAQEETPSE